MMGNVIRLRSPEMVETLDAATTLGLVQSLHRQLRVRDLLELFQRQANAVLPVAGLRYISPTGPIMFADTPSSEHYVKFRINWHNNENLGELYFYFDEHKKIIAYNRLKIWWPYSQARCTTHCCTKRHCNNKPCHHRPLKR